MAMDLIAVLMAVNVCAWMSYYLLSVESHTEQLISNLDDYGNISVG